MAVLDALGLLVSVVGDCLACCREWGGHGRPAPAGFNVCGLRGMLIDFSEHSCPIPDGGVIGRKASRRRHAPYGMLMRYPEMLALPPPAPTPPPERSNSTKISVPPSAKISTAWLAAKSSWRPKVPCGVITRLCCVSTPPMVVNKIARTTCPVG